jgi:hypothetical protein
VPTRRKILSNATIVLPTRTMHGSVVIEGDRIADISLTPRYGDGLDLHEQWLIPGVIDGLISMDEDSGGPIGSWYDDGLSLAKTYPDVSRLLATVVRARLASDLTGPR